MLMLHEITDPLIMVDDVNTIDIMNSNRHRWHNILCVRVNGEAITRLLWNQILQVGGMYYIYVCTISSCMARSTTTAANKVCSDRAFGMRLKTTGPKSTGFTNHSVYMLE